MCCGEPPPPPSAHCSRLFFFSYLCRANLLEPKIPFGEEKVLEGVGQLRPHSAEPAGGGVLPGHGQPDGQHLQQG